MTPSEIKHAKAWLISDGLDLVDVQSLDYNEVSHLIDQFYPGGLCGFLNSHLNEFIHAHIITL